MPIKVEIPQIVRRVTDGVSFIEVEAKTVGEVFEQMCKRFPGLRDLFFQQPGQLNRNLVVSVNDEMIVFMQNLDTPITPKDRLSIITGIGGG